MSQLGLKFGVELKEERDDWKAAKLSGDLLFRFMLWRRIVEKVDGEKTVLFVGLNPSKADDRINDPTAKKWMHYARRDGFGQMYVCNLSAFRATDPKDMKKPRNDQRHEEDQEVLLAYARLADKIVCCWGTHGSHLGMDLKMRQVLREFDLWRFDMPLTKNGQPWHCLYLKNDCPIVRWER